MILSRRDFMKAAGIATGSSLLAACAPTATSSPSLEGEPLAPIPPSPQQLKIVATSELGIATLAQSIDEYLPPFNTQRKVINFDKFPLRRIKNAEDFVSQAPQDLDFIIRLMEKRQTDPDVNPDVSTTHPIFTLGKGIDFLEPPTLLKLLKNLQFDLKAGYVQLSAAPSFEPGAVAGSYNVYTTEEEGNPQLYYTGIEFNDESILNESAPSLENPDEIVTASNLNHLVILFYEYCNRYSGLQDLIMLNKSGYFSEFPPEGHEEVLAAIDMLRSENIARGRRYSQGQNLLQIMFQRSIAALAGDANAKVIGMERNEAWSPYRLYTAAVNGDRKAQQLFPESLLLNADY